MKTLVGFLFVQFFSGVAFGQMDSIHIRIHNVQISERSWQPDGGNFGSEKYSNSTQWVDVKYDLPINTHTFSGDTIIGQSQDQKTKIMYDRSTNQILSITYDYLDAPYYVNRFAILNLPTIEIPSGLTLHLAGGDTRNHNLNIYKYSNSIMSGGHSSGYEDQNIGSDSTTTIDINVSSTFWLGVSDKEQVSAPALYPSPASAVLHLVNMGDLQLETYRIYDILGREVFESTLPAGNSQWDIDVTLLPNGAYFLQVGNRSLRFAIAH